MRLNALPLLCAALASPAVSEGRHDVWPCVVSKSCDAAGQCENSDEIVEFNLSPIDVGPDGEGTYQISYGAVAAQVTSIGWSGPLIWFTSSPDVQNTLNFAAADKFVWVSSQVESDPGASTIKFLTCELPA